MVDDLYRENILDHYKNPRNQGSLEHPDVTNEGLNPLCGDKVRVDLAIEDGHVKEVRFVGRGCAISQASTSMLTELIEGMTLEEVKKLEKEDVLELLGIELGPVRLKCALLPLETIKIGVYGYLSDTGQGEKTQPETPKQDGGADASA